MDEQRGGGVERNAWRWSTVAFRVITLLGLAAVPTAAQTPTPTPVPRTVSFSPLNATIATPSATTTVDVTVDQLNGVDGYTIFLRYDPAIVTVPAPATNSVVSDQSCQFFFPSLVAGEVRVSAVCLGLTGSQPAPLFTVTFQGVADGTTALEVNPDECVFSIGGQSVPCNIINGTIRVGPPASATPTDTPTDTPTATATSTPSSTPSNTPTETPTSTPTATLTDSPTATATQSPTLTATLSPTSTVTETSTPTTTATLTATPSSTVTGTPVSTSTSSPTSTETETPTATPTTTATASFSPTQVNTATAVPTATQTPPPSTATETPTATSTATEVATATASPPPSASPTNTSLPSPTQTAAPSATPTVSATPTATPVATSTPIPVPPVITNGLVAGSQVVSGTAAPNIPAPLLEICSAGPNNIPEGCVPGSDDVVLGTGGSDSQGRFTIVLSRRLIAGETVFAVDLRTGLAGPAAVVAQGAPVPDLNSWGASLLATAMVAGLIARLRRRSDA